MLSVCFQTYRFTMEGLQFVIEAPQDGPGRRKRARLVTSCDHCRVKKIRCIPSSNSNKCEACVAAQIPCQFRDREQYFTERSRILSRTAPDVQGGNQHGGGLAPSGAQMSVSILDTHGQLSGTPPPPDSHQTGHTTSPGRSTVHASSSRNPGPSSHTAYPAHSGPSASAQRSPQAGWGQTSAAVSMSPSPRTAVPGIAQSAPLPLFDPTHPNRPHMMLMTHYLPAYFNHYGHFFLFIVHDETIRRFLDQTLSPLIANCIAALAVWHTEIPDVVQRGEANMSDAYITQANTLLSQAGSSVETLQALILLAWAEYKRARAPEYFTYVQRAGIMARQLGLADGSLVQRARSDYERTILQTTWDIVKQLSVTIASVEPGVGST
ncbi:hypothetical protein B0H21DRAFT_794226 [Amylocystis lapponica]|nr:hypothetical protein B0H21DRAFT_794226 [Amylocystis lapponica]